MADVQLTSVAAGNAVVEAFGALTGEDLAFAAATLAGMLGLGGAPLVFAEAADYWEEAAGSLFGTPEALAAAEAPVDLPNVSNTLTMDGATFWNGRATATDTFTFDAPTGGTTHVRRVWVTASGGDCAAAAHANFTKVNWGEGVTVPSGKRALFLWEVDDTDDLLTFAGLED